MDKYSARKSACRIRFTDKTGAPLSNTRIHARLTKHEFLFGTGGFFALPLTSPDTDENYRAFLEKVYAGWKQVFNYTTLPFYLGMYEPEKGKPREAETLRAAELLKLDGKSIKGHPLCWHTVAARWMYDMSEEETLAYFLYRIDRELAAFRRDIGYWDVINEVVIMPEFVNEPANMPRMNPVTRLCRKMGRVPLIKTLFERAHAADPNAKLLLNDFNTSERYARLIGDCLDAGVGIDTIGIQSHQHQGFWGMEKLAEVTERFERFGLPIHYTENTFVSGHLMPPEIVDLNDYQVVEWPSTPEGEERQAHDLMTMLDYLFARPLVEGFTNWDYTDGGWLKAPSGLIRPDGSPKPALTQLKRRLEKDWHTDTDLLTDKNGCAELYGFRGEYELSRGTEKACMKLSKLSGDVQVMLQTANLRTD